MIEEVVVETVIDQEIEEVDVIMIEEMIMTVEEEEEMKGKGKNNITFIIL